MLGAVAACVHFSLSLGVSKESVKRVYIVTGSKVDMSVYRTCAMLCTLRTLSINTVRFVAPRAHSNALKRQGARWCVLFPLITRC
jgi:hypothetical protein